MGRPDILAFFRRSGFKNGLSDQMRPYAKRRLGENARNVFFCGF